ncbi:uncharacterized protein METZ01_LOCUS232563 [marine metagenome]|uniref:Uncharacterized protein n=1 Tax=marine metagenome TaxID=408172 RepID=A0A382GXK6_9ZZZZ
MQQKKIHITVKPELESSCFNWLKTE